MLKIRTRISSKWNGNAGAKGKIIDYSGAHYILEFNNSSDIPKYYNSKQVTDMGYDTRKCMLFSRSNFRVVKTKTKTLSKYIIHEKKI
jgi:hypothetical protein